MNMRLSGVRGCLPYAPTPEDTPDAPNGGAGASDAGKGGANPWTPPASQADFDRIVSDRLARERAKFSDYGDLKDKAAKFDDLQQQNATELERATKKAADEREQQVRTELTSAGNARLIASEARALAAEQKFRNPSLAVRSVDLSQVTVDDAGEVDAAAIRTALQGLATAEPYLLDDGKVRPQPDGNQGGGKTGKTSGSLVGLSGNDLHERLHPKKTA